ncbi:hypothetical protein EBR96_05880, partial [bacterium]|nr:hypothetical protein [bacterium]
MSQIEPNKPKKALWRSFGQLENSAEFKTYLDREFQQDAS